MKKPRKAGPRRRRSSPHDIPDLLKGESYFNQAHIYEPCIAPPHTLTRAERGVLARSEAILNRSDLTAEQAGDALLALVEIRQLRVRVSDFAGAVVDELELPPLGLALLLEEAMWRRNLRRPTGAAAPANHPQAGTVEGSPPTRSAPQIDTPAEQGAHQPRATVIGRGRKSPAARLCAMREKQARKVCTMSLNPSDARQVEFAWGWLGLGSWSEALAELDQIDPLMLFHPDIMEARLQIYQRAGQWEYAWHIGLVLINLVPDRVELWLATAHAARHAPNGGLHQGYLTLLLAALEHPTDWLVSFTLACYAFQRGEMGEGDWWLGMAGHQGGGKALQALVVTEPDMEPLRQFVLKREAEEGATDEWLE